MRARVRTTRAPHTRLVHARSRRGLVAQPLEREERGDVDEHGAAAARRVREQIDALRSGEKSVEVARSVGCAREQGTHHKMDGIPVVPHPKSRCESRCETRRWPQSERRCDAR